MTPAAKLTSTLICESLNELSAGMRVSPSVELVRPLRQGGMGTVWVGRHLALENDVAVKFIDPEALHEEPDLVDRFKREANITAKLRSPHVVHVFDHGKMGDDTPYIVMELLEGDDLRTRLRRDALSLREAALVVSQVSLVLERAHAHGVVHRDLKPENVFLIDSGYELFVKVLDFGVAKRTHLPEPSMTTTGTLVGTPSFMSPELIESSKDAQPSADLWSLGVIAYELLTGEKPFVGDTLGALCIAICGGRFTPPSWVRSDLGADVDRFFERVFSREAKDRFPNARELATAFQRAVNQAQPVRARLPSFPVLETATDDDTHRTAAELHANTGVDRDVSTRNGTFLDADAAKELDTLRGAHVAVEPTTKRRGESVAARDSETNPPAPDPPDVPDAPGRRTAVLVGWAVVSVTLGIGIALFGSLALRNAEHTLQVHAPAKRVLLGATAKRSDAPPRPRRAVAATAATTSAAAAPSSAWMPMARRAAHDSFPAPASDPTTATSAEDVENNTPDACFFSDNGRLRFRADQPECQKRRVKR